MPRDPLIGLVGKVGWNAVSATVCKLTRTNEGHVAFQWQVNDAEQSD